LRAGIGRFELVARQPPTVIDDHTGIPGELERVREVPAIADHLEDGIMTAHRGDEDAKSLGTYDTAHEQHTRVLRRFRGAD
jgi:hypothetical protein